MNPRRSSAERPATIVTLTTAIDPSGAAVHAPVDDDGQQAVLQRVALEDVGDRPGATLPHQPPHAFYDGRADQDGTAEQSSPRIGPAYSPHPIPRVAGPSRTRDSE